ncbi:MAG: PDZ domain-containing protein, partial [Thermoanaerobaculia bacterium]
FLAHRGPPWRGPRNSLNQRLTRIGEGRRVELVYLRQGKEGRALATLETAPPDFESAREHKVPDLGLTLKDLTYEVRTHYRLKQDSPGVVVAKVEPGGRAAVAKVLPFEILVSVNGRAVRSIEEFQRVLAAERASEGGDRVLEFKLERMGKSRLVRIRE